jgi:hypothetical protein
MKKVLIIVPLAVLGFLFIYLGCNLGIEVNPKGVSYNASTIFSVQAIDTSKTAGFVTFFYEFPPTLKQTKVIIKRTDAAGNDTVKIELGKPLVYNDLDTLKADQEYSYALALLNGGPTAYDTIKARTLPEVEITSPVDTVTGNAVDIVWTLISRAGTKFTDYKVELFRSGTNPDSILHYLANPVRETLVTFNATSIEGQVRFNRDTLTVDRPFTVRVTTSKTVKLNYLTDTSVGNRVFLWISPPTGKK